MRNVLESLTKDSLRGCEQLAIYCKDVGLYTKSVPYGGGL